MTRRKLNAKLADGYEADSRRRHLDMRKHACDLTLGMPNSDW